MAKVVYLSLKKDTPARGYWDHTFLDEMLEGIGESERVVVVIPGAYQGDLVPQINKELAKYEKVLVIETSDEENKFNVDALEHPDMILYSQCDNGGRMFPIGYPPETREKLKKLGLVKKDIDWFFSGQITHSRRWLLKDTLSELENGEFYGTDGFTKGMDRDEYLEKINRSRVVPCPSGAIVPESFRLYEALEAGCVPVADDMSPLKSTKENYWSKMFGNFPFPVFTKYERVPKLIDACLSMPDLNNQVFAWWINKKHQIKEQLKKDLEILEDDLVVVIPTSPIPSNPSTKIIEETIDSVRVHTDAPIIITIDGVREEQKDSEYRYREYVRKLLWLCNFKYENVLPVIFGKHMHQSGMIRTVLRNISIPLILYVEHDTPLTPDMDLELDKLKEVIKSGESNLIRFHFEALIPKAHKHLMIGKPKNGLLKTKQWSQRPHLASTEYYRRIMKDYFSNVANCFIEDRMHSFLQSDEWEDHKVHIYHPEGNIKRSYNLDGRKDDKKFDDKQVW